MSNRAYPSIACLSSIIIGTRVVIIRCIVCCYIITNRIWSIHSISTPVSRCTIPSIVSSMLKCTIFPWVA